MDAYVVGGTALAVVLVFLRCIGPHEWKQPRKWRLPEIGPALLVWFGSNALAAATKLFVLTVQNKLRIQQAHSLEQLSSEDVVIFLGGAIAAILAGLVTIQEGWPRIVPLPPVKTAHEPNSPSRPSDCP